MRIAIYHNQPPGGARRALHGFGTVLAKRHDIDVFTLGTSDQSGAGDADYAQEVFSTAFEPPRPRRGQFVLNDLREAAALSRLDDVNRAVAASIDRGGYDVVLVDACRFTFAPQVLAHLRTPAVYYCHHGAWRMDPITGAEDRSAYERMRKFAHGPARRWVEDAVRRIDRDMTRAAAAVAVNSTFTARRVRETCGVNASVCPPGVAIPPRQQRNEQGYVLSVGDIVPHKGHHVVIEAVGRLPAARRPELHLVGRGGGRTYREHLDAMASRLGVGLVVRTGISDVELEAEYRGASLFAYGARSEPLGLAPLEAMARQVPVVAIGEGGVVETVVEGVTGFLTRPEPAAMAERIADLLSSEAERREMGAAGRAEVERNWSLEHRTAALEDLLSRVGAVREKEAV
ncbi:MAG TPA: glycosyltransferase family 4 protein [Candidatus Dormibacteraeota bacterium]|nr:glycosyltransferase family 4 protein [Candidatus Dormibacteraeota bacterium]